MSRKTARQSTVADLPASSPTRGTIKSTKSQSIDDSKRKMTQSTSSLGTEKSEKSDKSSAKRKTTKSQDKGKIDEDKKDAGKENRKDLRRASSRKRVSPRDTKSKSEMEELSRSTMNSSTSRSRAESTTNSRSRDGTMSMDETSQMSHLIPLKDLADETLLRFVASEANTGKATDIASAYQMIRDGENLEQRTTSGMTPLVAASATGDKELVALLLERKADAGAVDSLGENELALHAAARRGHAAVVVLLADITRELGKLDLPSTAGWTPLHFAVRGGHLGAVKSLLWAKADASRQNLVHGGDTPVHIAARSTDTDVLEELLDWCPDGALNITNSNGETGLHAAARGASRSCVSTLLRFRADPTMRSLAGQTPMDIAQEGAEKRPATAAVVSLISAYMRPKPVPLRTDARFDR